MATIINALCTPFISACFIYNKPYNNCFNIYMYLIGILFNISLLYIIGFEVHLLFELYNFTDLEECKVPKQLWALIFGIISGVSIFLLFAFWVIEHYQLHYYNTQPSKYPKNFTGSPYHERYGSLSDDEDDLNNTSIHTYIYPYILMCFYMISVNQYIYI